MTRPGKRCFFSFNELEGSTIVKMGKLTMLMAMLNSYLKLPEGNIHWDMGYGNSWRWKMESGKPSKDG